MTCTALELDAFSSIFDSNRGIRSWDSSQAKEALRLREPEVEVYPFIVTLTDDEPFGDDPGGFHVTFWRPAQGKRYLVRRMPLAETMERLSKRNIKFNIRDELKAAQRHQILAWLKERV
jgi:hypothetical protein